MTMASTLNETALKERPTLEEALRKAINNRCFQAAVRLALLLNLPEDEVRNLKEQALKQIACEYRNAVATRNLAREWEIPRAQLEEILTRAVKEFEATGNLKQAGPAYDINTGKYLTLNDWVQQFLKTFDR